MVQISLPVFVIASSNWTPVGAGSVLAAIDEGIPSDGDSTYVRNTSSGNYLEVRMAATTDPGIDVGHKVRVEFRASVLGSPTLHAMVIGIADAGGELDSRNIEILSTEYSVAEFFVSAAAVAALSGNYSDIRIFVASFSDGSAGVHTRVSSITLEVPDTPPEVGLDVTSISVDVSSKLLDNPDVIPLPLPDDIPSFQPHDWSEPLTVETSYLTDVVSTPGSGSEERFVLRGRPARTITAYLTSVNRGGTVKNLFSTLQHSDERIPHPFYSEQTFLSQAYTSGTTIYADTSNRRFYAGCRILIASLDSGEFRDQEIASIASVLPDRIELDSALSAGRAAGSTIVIPLLDSEVTLNSPAEGVSDYLSATRLTFSEIPGPSSLPPSASDNLDSAESVLDGIPIFVVQPDWSYQVSIPVNRPGSSVVLGRANFVEVLGDRPLLNFDLSYLQCNREEFWRLLQFFDSRRGRGGVFLISNPITLYSVIEMRTTYVEVEAEGLITDHERYIKYISLELRDGTILIRNVTSFTDVGGVAYQISFEPALSSIPDVVRCTSGHLVRFAQDSLTEQWLTADTCLVSLSMIDLASEQEIDIANLDYPVPFGSNLNVSGLFLWASAGRNVSAADESSGYPSYIRTGLIKPEDVARAAFIDDARVAVDRAYADDLTIPEPFLAHIDPAQTSNPPVLVALDKWKLNRGRTICEAIAGVGPWDVAYQGGAIPWWNTGFTIFWCGRLARQGGGFNNHTLVWDGDPNNPPSSTIGFAFGTNFVRIGTFIGSFTSISSKADRAYVLRWEPGVSIQVYRNGVLKYSSTTSIPSSISKSTVFTKVHTGSAPNSSASLGGSSKIGNNGFFNHLFLFSKPLSVVELNLVGNHLSGLYPTFWNDV